MAQPQAFITITPAGRQQLTNIESIVATTGAADADKLVRVGTDGKLDPTIMPTGVGADTASVTASENLSAGDFVNVWDNAGTINVRKADASVAGKEADGFVLDAVLSGQPALVYFEGRNTALAALTLGARYFLSPTTPGTGTTTPPSTVGSGNVVQYLGRAISATSLAFEADDGIIL